MAEAELIILPYDLDGTEETRIEIEVSNEDGEATTTRVVNPFLCYGTKGQKALVQLILIKGKETPAIVRVERPPVHLRKPTPEDMERVLEHKDEIDRIKKSMNEDYRPQEEMTDG